MTTEQTTLPMLPVLTTAPFTGLGWQTRTTLTQMKQGVGDIPERLLAEIQRLGLTRTGPMAFHYDGVSGDVAKEFDLLIVVPIAAESTEPTEFSYQSIPAFSCASYTYTGPWEGIPEAYDIIFPAFYAQGHTYTGQVREVYEVVNFENPTNHVTDIQVGLGM